MFGGMILSHSKSYGLHVSSFFISSLPNDVLGLMRQSRTKDGPIAGSLNDVDKSHATLSNVSDDDLLYSSLSPE